MSHTLWLRLILVLLPAPLAAQASTTFKNVEYLRGSSALEDKEKGTLIVSASELQFANKKGKPYFTVPVSAIEFVSDTAISDNGLKKKLTSRLFGSSGPERQVIVAARTDSGVDTLVFKVHEEKDFPRIAATIQARVKGELLPEERTAKAEPAGNTGEAATPRLIMLVANPYTEAPTDSAAAVQVGTVIRDEVTKFAGEKFLVVTREQMNAALQPYGYPADAILSPALATTLATQIQAAVLVSGTMTKGDDGLYSISASLAAVGGNPGTPVVVAQQENEKLEDFGRRVADALKGPPSTP